MESKGFWGRMKLRGRLLFIMLVTLLLVVAVAVLCIVTMYSNAAKSGAEYAQNMGDELQSMTKDLFYQQLLEVEKSYIACQTPYLDARLDELERLGQAPDWDSLLYDSVYYWETLSMNPSASLDQFLADHSMIFYISNGTEIVAAMGASKAQALEKTNTLAAAVQAQMDETLPEQGFVGGDISQLFNTENHAGLSHVAAFHWDSPALLAWNNFDDGNMYLALYEETDNPNLVAGLFGELVTGAADNAITQMLQEMRLYLWLMLGIIVVLAVVIVIVSRWLALAVANPVEQEQERQQLALQRIAAEKEAIERVNQLKTEFLANVSHELKTPLTVMSSHAQHGQKTLAGIPAAEDAERGMRLIAGEADRLALMVTQVLDVTQIDEGRMALNVRETALPKVIQSTIDTYYPVFGKNGNTLLVQPASLPPVLCDADRITQVLVNLVGNAAKHTTGGTITISAAQQGNMVQVQVADTGSGIAPEDMDALFQRYRTKKAPGETGTGLGLYISKYIVQAHGGQLRIESEAGRGTTASFTLPVAPAQVTDD